MEFGTTEGDVGVRAKGTEGTNVSLLLIMTSNKKGTHIPCNHSTIMCTFFIYKSDF
jgi:hypothetical protein